MENLSKTNQTGELLNLDNKMLYKVSGLSSIILVVSYIIIIGLYFLAGAPPTNSHGEEWLKHITGHVVEWWIILGLSVFTDLLYIPVAYALYVILKDINKNAILTGAGFLVLFVILDLAITWTNYASLITLSNDYALATSDAQRMTIIAAANYASAVLSSKLFGIYVIFIPSIGILISGFVMLKGVFSKVTAYLSIVTGVLGIVSVGGAFFISELGLLVIITSILTTVWFFLVGYKLLKL
jgi:hypothetical protein